MPNIIEITDFSAPELDVYARYSEVQLLNRHEPEKGVFIAESPKVIGRALDAGCVPISLLLERAHVEGQGKEIISRCGEIPVYTAEFDVLTKLTGFKLTRGMLCAMYRPGLPGVEEVCRGARRIAVLDPVKLVVDNYPADKTEYFDIANNPNREANDTTTRKVAFTRELWIENEDFAEVPPPKFKRLTVGGEVRLMGGYIVKCESVEKNPDGSIAVIHCTADLETGNGNPADGRKVKGTIHWVSAAHAVDAEVRLYDKLFTEANMNAIPEGSDYKDYLNPDSVVVRKGCKLEEALADAKPGDKFQFVRTGFFTPDSKNPGVYNRVVTLRDSFKPAK